MARKTFEQGGGAGDDLGKNLNANFIELYTSVAAAQSTADTAAANALKALNAGKPFMAVATLTSAAAATPVSIVAAADVGAAEKIYISGFRLNVNGATAWTDSTATVVKIQDTATVPVVGISIAKAGLTGNVIIDTFANGSSTVSNEILRNTGFTAAKGLNIVADANFAAGSDIYVTVYGYIK